MIEYSGSCVVDIPNTSMSCGQRRPYKCRANGGHGISGCCPPDEDKNSDREDDIEEICDKIATCIDIVD